MLTPNAMGISPSIPNLETIAQLEAHELVESLDHHQDLRQTHAIAPQLKQSMI